MFVARETGPRRRVGPHMTAVSAESAECLPLSPHSLVARPARQAAFHANPADNINKTNTSDNRSIISPTSSSAASAHHHISGDNGHTNITYGGMLVDAGGSSSLVAAGHWDTSVGHRGVGLRTGMFSDYLAQRIRDKAIASDLPSHMRMSDIDTAVRRVASMQLLQPSIGSVLEPESPAVTRPTSAISAQIQSGSASGPTYSLSATNNSRSRSSTTSRAHSAGSKGRLADVNHLTASLVISTPSIAVVSAGPSLQQGNSRSRTSLDCDITASIGKRSSASRSHPGLYDTPHGTVSSQGSVTRVAADPHGFSDVPPLPPFLQPHMYTKLSRTRSATSRRAVSASNTGPATSLYSRRSSFSSSQSLMRSTSRTCRPKSGYGCSAAPSILDGRALETVYNQPYREHAVIVAPDAIAASALSQIVRARRLSVGAHGYTSFVAPSHNEDPAIDRLGDSVRTNGRGYADDIRKLALASAPINRSNTLSAAKVGVSRGPQTANITRVVCTELDAFEHRLRFQLGDDSTP